ncbi:pentapeptide repeat-containing protein [Sulfurovum sp.]|uniref:pentapeptide repeat-containing protein n=1 Tax=Sulfurovum sp. TaxID=1969726 RepID=UPI0025F7CA59|nr:pentapeptide repeat-containing protein [Sulfurovum sp.]
MNKYKIIIMLYSTFILLACNSNTNAPEKVVPAEKEIAPAGIITESSGDLARYTVTSSNKIVLNLESQKSHKNDIPPIGADAFDVYIDRESLHTYCFENDLGAGYDLIIADKNETRYLDMTQGCHTVNLKQGIYRYTLRNGSGKSHTVFFYPKEETSSLATPVTPQNTSGGLQNRILAKKTVISFDICKGCNLFGLNLSHLAFSNTFVDSEISLRLEESYLKKLDITQSDFFKIQNQDRDEFGNENKPPLNMELANLDASDLSYSVFENTNFDGVSFIDANLSHTVFWKCTFKGANFNYADMTRTVFYTGEFGSALTFSPVIVSQPSITNLFGEKSNYDYDLTAAVDNNNRLVLFNSHKDPYAYGVQPFLPNGLKIVSPPSVVPNNFVAGFSVFVKASDGYVYEYLKHGADIKGPAKVKETWYRIEGTQVCESNPDATYKNHGGSSSSNELYVTVACQDMKGTLHTWTRYFYNKYNKARDSRYGNAPNYIHDWGHASYPIQKTDSEISINRDDLLVFVKDNKLAYINYRNNDLRSTDIMVGSRVDLNAVFTDFSFVYHEDVYAGSLTNASENALTNLGHPQNGVISSPSIGGGTSVSGSHPFRVVVLSGDGKLYSKNADGSGNWEALILGPHDSPTYPFYFNNNTLKESYLKNVNLSPTGQNNIVINSNIQHGTFYTEVNLSNSKFNKITLDNVTFDHAAGFDNVAFKNATLVNLTLSQNTNPVILFHTDFSGSYINGLTWTNNTSYCVRFDDVTFGEKPIVSHSNQFFSQDGCAPASFREAVNVPVELIASSNSVENMSSEFLVPYDFSSASFSDSFYSLDFRDANMSGSKFGGVSQKRGADLSGIDASGSVWEDANLSYVTCTHGNFNHTVFRNSTLYQAHFDSNSSFIESQWIDTDASYAQFQNSSLSLLSVKGEQSRVDHTAFNNSILRGADFSGIDLTGSTFNNVDMYPYYETDIVDTNLSDTTLTQSIFTGALLGCSNMSGVDFTGAVFTDADLRGADFSSPVVKIQADFHQASMDGINFSHVTFDSSDLSGATFNFTFFAPNPTKVSLSPYSDATCPGYNTPPKTGSDTTCPDGNKPNQSCEL